VSAVFRAAHVAEERQLTCAEWAERYRVMGSGAAFPGKLTHRYHPWTRDIRNCDSRMMVCQKSAQSGLTEVGVDRALYDLIIQRRDVLYVLPDDGAASDFASGRIDPALELSPRLAEYFSDVSNVGHKRAGSVNIYIRGSKSRTGLKVVPVANLVLDELNEMSETNVELVFERVSGQPEENVRIAMFSTPTIPEYGISEFIEASSKCEYFFTCPHCGKRINLLWPRNFCLDRNRVICHECNEILPDATKGDRPAKADMLQTGEWIARHADQHTRCAGYWNLNQLYSCTVTARTIRDLWDKAQIKIEAEQEFYNSKMAMPHVSAGAKLELRDVRNCYTAQEMQTSASRATLGVDVGKWYYWVASEWEKIDADAPDHEPTNWRRHILCVGKCLSTNELAEVIYKFNAYRVAVDAQPETREMKRLQRPFKFLWLCWIKEIADTIRVREHIKQCDVNRTEWLDLLADRVRKGQELITIPSDVGKEFEDHLQSPTRVYMRDKLNNTIARYQSAGEDHYAFAAMLDEVAHFIGFVGQLPPKPSDEYVRKVLGSRAKRMRPGDARRYTADVLERLTGFRKPRR